MVVHESTPMPSPRYTRHDQRGQTLPLIAVFMVVLLGFCAFAIDMGSWYQQDQQLQASADAAALAGASELANSWPAAQSAASHEYALNGNASDTVSYMQGSDFTSNDSISVSASRPANSFFASIFGIHPTISVTARATVESYTATPAQAT